MNQPKKQSDIVHREIGILTNKTIEYNKKIKAAKTRTKVDYYYKKMVKNNQKISLLLSYVQKLEDAENKASVPVAQQEQPAANA